MIYKDRHNSVEREKQVWTGMIGKQKRKDTLAENIKKNERQYQLKKENLTSSARFNGIKLGWVDYVFKYMVL